MLIVADTGHLHHPNASPSSPSCASLVLLDLFRRLVYHLQSLIGLSSPLFRVFLAIDILVQFAITAMSVTTRVCPGQSFIFQTLFFKSLVSFFPYR